MIEAGPAPAAAALTGALSSWSSLLTSGAERELELTPKPGLVDVHDCGSHPDLSFEGMKRSVRLLPIYYRELLEAQLSGAGLEACRLAGVRAEERMLGAVGANAHRGYIFLSGLVLLAAAGGGAAGLSPPRASRLPVEDWRRRIVRLASRLLDRPESGRTHGSRIRRELGVGTIRAEALSGLPAVFEVGLPALVRFRESTGDDERASFYTLARLMQWVEDSTALQRGGIEGLRRLRRDGRVLQLCLEEGDDPHPLLRRWNREYVALNLTMGGVADCLALSLALVPIRSGGS